MIIGKNRYKTYLAQLLLPDIKPIQLNFETFLGQLLGSTIFLSDSKFKAFYLKQIYNILDTPIKDRGIKMVQNWIGIKEINYEEIKKEQKNLLLEIDDLFFKKNKKKFRATLDILKKKLINDNYDKQKFK